VLASNAMGRARLLALLALWTCGCGGAEAPVGPVWRAVSPDEDGSTAALERVELGIETRPVLAHQPVLVTHWREPVTLGSELEVTTEPPPELAPDALASVETWVSVRSEEEEAAEAGGDGGRGNLARALARLRSGGRDVLRAGPEVLRAAQAGSVHLDVPPELRGKGGLLSQVLRPLPSAPKSEWRSQALQLPAGARLRFGYGVEKEAWGEGWPAVAFRVRVEPADGDPQLVFDQLLDPARQPSQRRWLDASVDLSALAGRSARLVFETEALASAPEASVPASLAVFSVPELRARPPLPGRSVILVSLDTLRARSVSAYGSARATTPSLDGRLAAAGALVRQAVTPFPYTPPSHMTMLTGLDPCMHGVVDQYGVLPSNQLTLAELLSRAGYRTAAFTEDGYVTQAAGFARGFDLFVERRDERSATPGWAKETFAAATRWLEDVGDDPFFLFVHTYQVHAPYSPPPAYRDMFVDDVTEGARKPLREPLRNYEREIRYTDDVLAEFLRTLDQRGLAERSIVVVTSDHGEAFGEHMAQGHGFDSHDEAVLVPLVLRAPGLIAPGSVVEEQVGLADLVPTLLDLAGQPTPPDLAGRSFAGVLRGEQETFEERPILIETSTRQTAVRTGAWKYILYPSGKERLYHLADDPQEHRGGGSEGLEQARASLEARRAACEAWLREHPPQAAEAARGSRAPGWRVNRDEIDAQLRALGYAE
jgi:arylsulfatase A-like enzyme